MNPSFALAIASILAVLGCGSPVEPAGGGSGVDALSPGPAPTPVGNPFQSQPFRMAAMGDSISRGYNISGINIESLSLNWSTGEAQPTSQINRIKSRFSQKAWSVSAQVQNVAVAGESVLGGDSTFFSQASFLTIFAPYYVTLQIGVNDVCQGYVSSASARTQFRDRLISVLRTLIQSPNAPKAILVASMPRVWRLQEIPQLAQAPLCQLSWAVLCPQMSVGQAAFEQQWQATNQAILDAVAAVGGPVVYDGGITASTVLSAGDVSASDCFHPSAAGQARLSAAAWAAVEPKFNSLWGQ